MNKITINRQEMLNGTVEVSTRVVCDTCDFSSFCLRIGNEPPPAPRCPYCTRDNSLAGRTRRWWLHALSVATWFRYGEGWIGSRR